MKVYTCPDCGKKFQEGFVPSECPQCGCPSNVFTVSEMASQATKTSPMLESSNDFAAEKLGAILADIMKVIGFIIIIGSFIAGIVFSANSYGDDKFIFFLIIFGGGLILGFLFFCMWAWMRLMVNISYRLTRIDNKTKAK